MFELQSIVNLDRFGSMRYTAGVIGYSEVIFIDEREDAAFCPFVYYVLVVYTVAVSELYVFHTSRGISSRPAAFLFLIFLCTTSSCSCVNCPSLMSSGLLMIFVTGSSVNIYIYLYIKYI